MKIKARGGSLSYKYLKTNQLKTAEILETLCCIELLQLSINYNYQMCLNETIDWSEGEEEEEEEEEERPSTIVCLYSNKRKISNTN